MATTTRWSSADKFRVRGAMSALSTELTVLFETQCYATRLDAVDEINHPGESLLTVTSSVALNDAELDTALANFPSDTAVAGTVPVVSGNDYLIGDPILVEAGESLDLDIHVHATLGSAADFVPQQFEYHACVYRRTAGGVLFTDPTGTKSGKVPGLSIKIVGDDNLARVYATLRAEGDLTIIKAEVFVASRGPVPP